MKLVSATAILITHLTIMLALATIFVVWADPVNLTEILDWLQGFGVLVATMESVAILFVVLPVGIWKLGAFGLRVCLPLLAISWVSYLSILGLWTRQILEYESLVGVAGSIFLGWVLMLLTEPQEKVRTQVA